MDILKRFFHYRASCACDEGQANTDSWGEVVTDGVKNRCRRAGISPNQLYRVMSGNTRTMVVGNRRRVEVQSWLIYYMDGTDHLMANIGALPDGDERGIVRTGTMVDSTGRPWFGPQKAGATADMASVWRNGPLGVFKLDFLDVVAKMESQGYQLMADGTRLLRLISCTKLKSMA